MPHLSKDQALVELALHNHALNLDATDCVLCALLRQRPNDALFESNHAQVRLVRFASTRGHLMVVAKTHVEEPHDLGLERYLEMQTMAYRCSLLLRQHLRPRRVYIAALGAPKALPMSFPHFHIHLIPVYVDDERARPAHVFTWNNGVTTYDDDEALALVGALRAVAGELSALPR